MWVIIVSFVISKPYGISGSLTVVNPLSNLDLGELASVRPVLHRPPVCHSPVEDLDSEWCNQWWEADSPCSRNNKLSRMFAR